MPKLLILINLMFLNFLYLFNLLGKYLLINLMILDSIKFLSFLNLSTKKSRDVKNGNGKMCMTRVVLRPVVCFSGEGPSQVELQKLHEKAHRGCFIATSVNAEILVEPPIE